MKIKVDEKLEKLTTTIQQKLDGNPAILIGCGGSIPYGLPSMAGLADEITSKLNPVYQNDDGWKTFVAELSASENLEMALEKVSLQDEILKSIIWTVWALIDQKDREAINRFLKDGTSPVLTSILKKSVQRVGATTVVTTNYDRLIECAIDFCQGEIKTCFSGNCIKRFNGSPGTSNRIINLYKVHGSVDWFKHQTNHNIIATHYFDKASLGKIYCPMIVAPGNKKYKETHQDPYRTVITEADKALRGAAAYLCIGYGFNDEHIQPIIINENRERNKPIVIVTKAVTAKMKELFLQKDSFNSLIVSEEPMGGTLVYYSNCATETFTDKFWCLDSFYKLWFE